MHCPACNFRDTKVVDSRVSSDGLSIRRRRECERCGHRFSTLEALEILDLVVVKRDGRREPYSRQKLESGLRKALEKRPVTAEDFRKLTTHIERDIQRKGKSEVTSKEIGELVMKHLRQFDTVAYLRFASVYRSFEDAQTFEKELRHLLSAAPKKFKRKKLKKRPGK
ncbi:transcriptional repressor NrdR [Patescibacteria group bacterium]|nr:MAG: transcriptional repressor NrdR [Patescibacteria group bacterium]